jgi:hypothetical protein
LSVGVLDVTGSGITAGRAPTGGESIERGRYPCGSEPTATCVTQRAWARRGQGRGPA